MNDFYGGLMSYNHSLPRLIVAWTLLSIGVVACGTAAAQSPATQAQPKPEGRWSHQDWPTSRILKFDLNGNFLYGWGAPGPQAGRLNCSHGITTDQLGNLYLADCFAGRLQKFEPIPGADPDKIAGQILRTWDTWKRP